MIKKPIPKYERKYEERKRAYQTMRQDFCSKQNLTYCSDYKSQKCPLTCNYAKSRLEEELGEWADK